ncbi:MAG: aldo/keto reductase [Gemmatimonadota bacterium]
MDYVNLGRAGVKVSRICLGTAFRGQADDKTCVRIIDRALDLGCNFIDSANFYGQGRSETIVGKALKQKRDDAVLTTKVWSPMGQGPNDRGLSRFHIMRELERSLKRLQTSHVDLYLLHAFDGDTPLDETLRAMDDLVAQGKVRYVGACNFTAAQVVESLWTGDSLGLRPLACLQNQYNLLHRWELEPELLSLCRRRGLGLMTYSPLAIGLLSGRFRKGQAPPPDSPWAKGHYDLIRALTDQVDDIIQTLVDLGGKHGKSPAQVAVAWILDHEEVSAAIVGPDTPDHVDDVCGGLEWRLTPEERHALDQASRVELPKRYA